MPAKPRWLIRIPEILEELEEIQTPVVDRAMCERLFGLQRRRTITLLHLFGGYQAGSTFLVDRRSLMKQLRRIHASPDFAFEFRRREKLVNKLEELRRQRAANQVKILVEEAPEPVAGLPEGVALTRGRLTIDFASPEELLRKLYELSQAIAADFEQFRQQAELGSDS